jgi:hypothetical protein
MNEYKRIGMKDLISTSQLYEDGNSQEDSIKA